MKQYANNHIWDFLLVSAISVGFALNLLSAFRISYYYLTLYPALVLLSLLLNALLFLAGYNKKTVIAGIVAGAAAVAGALLHLRNSGLLNLNEQIDKSLPLFLACIAGSSVASYLFTRGRVLSMLWALCATFLCAVFVFLQYPVSVPGFLLMEFACAGKIFMTAATAGKAPARLHRKLFLQSVAIALAGLLLASGAYYIVVRPLAPATRELKLITRFMSWDIWDTVGVSSRIEKETKELTSDLVNDRQRQTSLTDDTSSNNFNEDKVDEEERNDSFTKNAPDKLMALSVSYSETVRSLWFLFAALALLVVLTAPFVIKCCLIRARRKRVMTAPPCDGVVGLYAYFLKCFRHMGLVRSPTETVLEYAAGLEPELRGFDVPEDFTAISRIYSKTIYGSHIPTEDEYRLFQDYYLRLRKNIRAKAGGLKYCRLFWVI